MSLSGGISVSHSAFLMHNAYFVSSDISLADATVPSVVPATPAPQTHLTLPSSPVISKTPKTPSKPRKKSSSPQACKTPSKTHFKTLAKKGSIKDAFLLSTGPKVRLAISCHGCREARKPVCIYSFRPFCAIR